MDVSLRLEGRALPQPLDMRANIADSPDAEV